MMDADKYYETYHGHRVDHLEVIFRKMKEHNDKVIWFAGDSSLDNKYWFKDQVTPVNGHDQILRYMKPDVCYWMNKLSEDQNLGAACINTAVEATSLNTRSLGRLTPQDRFIRDNITEDDSLIVSIGGNDVALEPLACTVCSVASMMCVPEACLKRAVACPPNQHCDLGCICCGLPGCAGELCGFPLGFGYAVDMFKNRVGNYIRRLISKRRPKKVIICMIYYPDVQGRGGWADTALAALCYNKRPGKLQLMIRKLFEYATSRIQIPGTEVVPMPLYEVLDGKNTSDYVERVEPSPQGGMKMATAFMDILTTDLSVTAQPR